MPSLKNPIHMAVIGAPHGIRGELRVKTFTGDPLALGDYGPLYARDGRAFEVLDIRSAGTVVVVRFKGDEDDFYHADLIGLSVRDDSGATIGKVAAVHNFGGGDILDLTLGGRRGVLIPFSKAAVPEVSVAGGYITVDPVAAGLVEDEDSEPEADRRPAREGNGKQRPRGPKDAGGNR